MNLWRYTSLSSPPIPTLSYSSLESAFYAISLQDLTQHSTLPSSFSGPSLSSNGGEFNNAYCQYDGEPKAPSELKSVELSFSLSRGGNAT